jgi:hypothetical protein
MSKFKALTQGLEHLAPHTKALLKENAEKLKALQDSPNPDINQMKKLSDMLQSTVEANAKRTIPASNIDPEIPGLKKMNAAMAGLPAMQGNINPVDTAQYLRDKTTDYLSNITNVGNTSQGKELGKRVFDAATNPFNFVGGIGAADAALAIPDLIEPGSFGKLKEALFKKP